MATGQFAGDAAIPWRDDALTAIGAVSKAGDSMTGQLNVTVPNGPGFRAFSGAADKWGGYSVGRTALEGYVGVAGPAGSLFAGDAPGDMGVRAEGGTLRLGIGSTPQVALSVAGGFSVASAALFSGPVPTTIPATQAMRLGAISPGYPMVQWINTAAVADQRFWDCYAGGSSLIFRAVSDDYTGTRWMEVMRSGAAVSSVQLPTDVAVGSAIGQYVATNRRVFNVQGTTDSLISLQGQSYLWHDTNGAKLELAASGTRRLSFVAGGVERTAMYPGGGVSMATPTSVGKYTLTTLPSASAFSGYMIDVTNATGGAKLCRSNGSVWQIINTTTTVS